VILIVASVLDALARDVAESWPGGSAIVLTPRDVCTQGWRIDLEHFDDSQFSAGGRTFPVRDITGVITLLPHVMEYELFTIEDAERRYVASEVMAFLFYFLSRLQCPVLNRPTAHCLNGPGWRPERWKAACERAGMRSELFRPESSSLPSREFAAAPVRVAVVGARCIGEASPGTLSSILKLARIANVDFLTVWLSDTANAPTVNSVELAPDLRDGPVLAAMQSYFGATQ
jgi:hypothetical protein